MRAIRPRSVWSWSIVALAACSSGVTDAPPGGGGGDTTNTPGGTVPRTSLSVQVTIDPADQAITSRVGVTTAGLSVRLTRGGSQDAPRTAVTDASGRVRFDQLLDGTYTVSVERALSASEVAALEPADREVTILAGGAAVPVSPPAAPSVTVALVGARRGGLVISEGLQYDGNPPYNWGFYAEIFNNSDTTIYIDGYTLAATGLWHDNLRAPCGDPTFARFRQDATRLWVLSGVRFPGTGRDYPVLPGRSVIYAADALDHRVASGSADYADLSSAEFEHVASPSDTDNPGAANVQPVFGTTTGTGGRGLRIGSPTAWVLIAPGGVERATVDTMVAVNPAPTGGLPRTPNPIFGVPRDAIADVVSVYYAPTYQAYLLTTTFGLPQVCRPFVPVVYDRLEGELSDSRLPGAFRRRSLGRTADGREILMRTKTSARDFERTQNLLARWQRRP